MKSAPLKTGQIILNQLFKEAVNQHGARWITTESLLTDAPGEYSKFKNNADGKPISVRSDDGVHLTPSGQRLLAAQVMAQFSLPLTVNPAISLPKK